MKKSNLLPGASPRADGAQELRSAFLASVTHEFRTPLASLNASVEYMLDEFTNLEKDDIHELLKSVHLSVTGLQTLIDNLLESLTFEAGRFVIHPEDTDLNAIIDEAIHIVKPLLTRRGQKLVRDQSNEMLMVHVDATRLTQVLVNLLSNASKYGPMEQTILIKAQPDGEDMLRISVTDQGPGIPKAERSKLFQRFTRLENLDGPQYGIGLGLSVVKIIIDEHGGQTAIEDAPGGGSVFWISVPVVKEDE